MKGKHLRTCRHHAQFHCLTWRHNRVLQEVTAIADIGKDKTKPTLRKTLGPLPSTSQALTEHITIKRWTSPMPSFLDRANNWDVITNLPEIREYPEVIRKTGLQPAMVVYSEEKTDLIMNELYPFLLRSPSKGPWLRCLCYVCVILVLCLCYVCVCLWFGPAALTSTSRIFRTGIIIPLRPLFTWTVVCLLSGAPLKDRVGSWPTVVHQF